MSDEFVPVDDGKESRVCFICQNLIDEVIHLTYLSPVTGKCDVEYLRGKLT